MGAQVLDWELQQQLVPHMKHLEPLPGIYDQNFIAANQEARASNVIKGSRQEQVDTVREQIRTFQSSTGVDKVIVLWTANTERFAEVGLLPRLVPSRSEHLWRGPAGTCCSTALCQQQ